ncbi:hypothetical protein RRG08_040862 [Elysia crispata]|uniref:Uncharacterized protein n=1 Tax=Elysia crispata TaxID=231223 RepID=A0AAE1E7H3_9GAST|nr:hypothetical protein RRG08_040862 [Elysia crispata]
MVGKYLLPVIIFSASYLAQTSIKHTAYDGLRNQDRVRLDPVTSPTSSPSLTSSEFLKNHKSYDLCGFP